MKVPGSSAMTSMAIVTLAPTASVGKEMLSCWAVEFGDLSVGVDRLEERTFVGDFLDDDVGGDLRPGVGDGDVVTVRQAREARVRGRWADRDLEIGRLRDDGLGHGGGVVRGIGIGLIGRDGGGVGEGAGQVGDVFDARSSHVAPTASVEKEMLSCWHENSVILPSV